MGSDSSSIDGRVTTVDALLTQRHLANCLILKCDTHYHFTVKDS